jgi:hypothetical protein
MLWPALDLHIYGRLRLPQEHGRLLRSIWNDGEEKVVIFLGGWEENASEVSYPQVVGLIQLFWWDMCYLVMAPEN